jgi:hypothetical protein
MTFSPRTATLLTLPLVGLALHCGNKPDGAGLLTSDEFQSPGSINGGSTGAFDREFTPAGYSAISATVTVPAYDAPTDGSDGEPYIYYIFSDDLGSVAMEAGLAFQHGMGTSPPPRWRPYLRGAGPGNNNSMQFADETYSIQPGSTVSLSATFDGSTVRLKVGSAIVKSEGLAGLAQSSTHAARVVSNAVSGAYSGGPLGTVGPVVFSGTTVYPPSGASVSFDSVEGWSTTYGGKLFGTVQFPSSMITITRSGGTDTITLFPASTTKTSGGDAGSGSSSSEAGSGTPGSGEGGVGEGGAEETGPGEAGSGEPEGGTSEAGIWDGGGAEDAASEDSADW